MKASLLCFAILSGCCTAVDYPIGIPERPELEWITPEEQAAMPDDTLTKISSDYVKLQNHIIKLENRVLLHDEHL